MLIQKPKVARYQEKRQRQHDWRDHSIGDEPEPQVFLAAELEPRERECCGNSQNQRKRRGADGDNQRVDQRAQHPILKEGLAVVHKRRFKDPDRRRFERYDLRFQRGRHHPVKWENAKRYDQDQNSDLGPKGARIHRSNLFVEHANVYLRENDGNYQKDDRLGRGKPLVEPSKAHALDHERDELSRGSRPPSCEG